LFVFFIPWEGVVELPGLGTATKLIGFVLAAFWLAAVVITGRFRKPDPFHIVVTIFVLWNAVSIFWSANPGKTVTHLQTWAQILVLVFIMWDLYDTRTALLSALQMFVLGEYVAIGYAISNFASGNVYYTTYQRFSPAGQTNPDGFGFILALGIPVAWYLASSSNIGGKWSGLLKIVNYAYIPAAFLGISLSGTRTALLASIPAMAFGIASLARLRLWARVAIFLVFVAAIFISLPYLQTLTSFQRFSTIGAELGEGDLNQRSGIWSDGLAAFAERPLVGVGRNMYRSVNSLGKLAHNSFISVLVEVGLIGFALFGIILTLAVLQALGQPKWDKRFWLTFLAVWVIGASSLSWEFRKPTWLLLSLMVVSGALASRHVEASSIIQRNEPTDHFLRSANMNKLPQGE
jgi:O-antigen ligase